MNDFQVAEEAARASLANSLTGARLNIVAEAVAAFLLGNGIHGAARWATFSTDEQRRAHLVRTLQRDLPESAIVSSGPIDMAVKVGAEALLARHDGRD